MPSPAGTWLEIDAADGAILYAAGANEVVWSPSYGVTWSQVDLTGLPTEDTMTSFSIDPTSSGLLYAGFEDGGVFKTQVNVSSVSVGGDQHTPVHVTLAAQPNPFRTWTRLRIGSPGDASSLSVGIYDVAGRLVRRLNFSSGEPAADVTWDGRNERGVVVPPGTYFAGTRFGAATRLVKVP